MLSTLGLLLFQGDPAQEIPSGAAAAGLGIFVIVSFAVVFLMFALMWWKVFAKAGKPGWASIILIYNFWVLLEIAGKPGWWCLIPILNFIMIFLIAPFEIAKRFGKSAGFGVGLLLLGPIFYPILGFGDAQYNPTA